MARKSRRTPPVISSDEHWWHWNLGPYDYKRFLNDEVRRAKCLLARREEYLANPPDVVINPDNELSLFFG